MWQRVLPSNPQLVEAAFQVLSVHGSPWSSALDFKLWLETHNDRVFYFTAEKFQLVIGFRSEGGGVWRGTLAGMDGDLSFEAIRELFAKAMSFAKERSATALLARVRKRSPSDPLSTVYQFVIGIAHGDSEVESVAATDHGRYRDYTFTMKSSAA